MTDYAVSKTGTGDFTTISAAVNVAQPGDTVYINAGVYYERLVAVRSGVVGNPIRFISLGAVLDNRALTHTATDAAINLIGKDFIIVDGFEIYPASNERSVWCGLNDKIQGQTKHSSDITISNNLIHGTTTTNNVIHVGDYGGYLSNVGLNKNIIIDGNIIEMVGGQHATIMPEMISCSCTDSSVVSNNQIHNALGIGIDLKAGNTNMKVHHNKIIKSVNNGIYIDGYAKLTDNVEIYDNYISTVGPWIGPGYTVPQAGIVVNLEFGASPTSAGEINNVRIYNNIIENCTLFGIKLGGSSQSISLVRNYVNDIFIENNTIVGCGYGSIQTDQYGYSPAYLANIRIRNNLLHGNKVNGTTPNDNIILANAIVTNLVIENNHYTVNTGLNTGSSFTYGNPLFISSSDYHITTSSPAYLAGMQTDAPTTDYFGVVRPSPPSIGALEPLVVSPPPPAQITLTYSVYGSGSVSYNGGAATTSGTVQVPVGTSINLNALPSQDNKFVKWLVGTTESTLNPLQIVNLMSNTDVVAFFEPIPPIPPVVQENIGIENLLTFAGITIALDMIGVWKK